MHGPRNNAHARLPACVHAQCTHKHTHTHTHTHALANTHKHTQMQTCTRYMPGSVLVQLICVHADVGDQTQAEEAAEGQLALLDPELAAEKARDKKREALQVRSVWACVCLACAHTRVHASQNTHTHATHLTHL